MILHFGLIYEYIIVNQNGEILIFVCSVVFGASSVIENYGFTSLLWFHFQIKPFETL